MAGGYFDGGADEGDDGAGAAGGEPGCHDLARAEVGDRDEGQPGSGAVLAGEGDGHVGDRVAERNGVQKLADVVDLGTRRGLGGADAAGP